MLLTILFLVLGFFLLIKGADFLIDGSVSLAKRLKVSDIVVGLTIVAFGTSTPELIVNIMASINGNSEIATGNIIGSNILNIFFILGVSALIYPLLVLKNTVWKEIPLSLLAAVLVGVLGNDRIIDGSAANVLTRIDGLVLLSFFVIFLVYVVGISKVSETREEIVAHRYGYLKIFFLITLGLGLLVLGGKCVVDSAVSLARMWGVSESLIGLTIVAVGTSLPELATSAVAASKKKADIAVGNIVGSNIFNIFFILGISAVMRPIPLNVQKDNMDIGVCILASFLLFALMFFGQRHVLSRKEGAIFLFVYAGYIFCLINRG